MASFEEIEVLLPYISVFNQSDGKEIVDAKEIASNAFEKNQKDRFLTFRQFQKFLKDVGLEDKAEGVDS